MESAQDQGADVQAPKKLDSLSTQVKGLPGKHGLDSALADQILAMIKIIQG